MRDFPQDSDHVGFAAHQLNRIDCPAEEVEAGDDQGHWDRASFSRLVATCRSLPTRGVAIVRRKRVTILRMILKPIPVTLAVMMIRCKFSAILRSVVARVVVSPHAWHREAAFVRIIRREYLQHTYWARLWTMHAKTFGTLVV